MKNSVRYRDYVPYPFWAMDQEFFFKYANDLKGDDRGLLSFYPFKWAYVPPHDSAGAVEFLRDIGVEEDRVTVEDVAAKFENMTSFELLEQEGTVQWGGDILYDNPPPGFRMIPEWEPMSGVLLNWPTLYPDQCRRCHKLQQQGDSGHQPHGGGLVERLRLRASFRKS